MFWIKKQIHNFSICFVCSLEIWGKLLGIPKTCPMSPSCRNSYNIDYRLIPLVQILFCHRWHLCSLFIVRNLTRRPVSQYVPLFVPILTLHLYITYQFYMHTYMAGFHICYPVKPSNLVSYRVPISCYVPSFLFLET